MKFEIEVKAKVNDFSTIISNLEKIGCVLSESIVQDDYIFNKKGVDLKDHSHNYPVLRIRVQGQRTMFTLKKNRSGELDCIEKEIDVGDKDVLKDIIELLDYEKTVEVHKKRRKGMCNGYEVCLDEVEGLGSFIEVEKISDEDGVKVQQELLAFLESLGVNKEDQVFIGYDSLMMKKNKNFN